MLSNESQAYWIIGSVPEQKQITGNHQNARVQTNGVRFDRGDNVIACAKHFTNTGNPTQSCTGNSSGQCPGGSNDQTTLQGAPDPVTSLDTLYPGMSQNGTAAWVKGDNPWDWRQIASHYYNKALFPDNNPEYRWVWLDVGTDIVFTGYGNDEFYGPVFNAPNAMEVGQNYNFSIHLQNTSTLKWQRTSANRTRIGLYWDGNRNAATLISLDEDMDPGEDDNVTLSISPPASGTHCLSVDMYRNGQWFSDQSSPAWPVLTKCISVAEADTTPPTNPNNQNGSHSYNQWSNDNTISAQWSGASDNRTPTNQLAYSIDWTPSGSTTPDTGVDTTNPNATSPALADGSWYLHVRTRDNAGNWNNGAAHFCPFKIDATPPSGWHEAPEWSATSDFMVNWYGFDSGGSGITFDFDYKINNGSYQNWFETSAAPDSRLYNLSANPNDVVHIRSCIRDDAGNTSTPPCRETQTQFRTTPYLNATPTEISHCFLLTETIPFSSTLLVENNGPGLLDWAAVVSHTHLTLWPVSGTDVNSSFPAQTVYTLTNPAAVGFHTGVIAVSSPTSGVGNNPLNVSVTIRVVPDACIHFYHFPIIFKQN